MTKKEAFRFWGESALAAVAGLLAVLTAVWPDWVEGVFGFEPDRGNGSFEWALVVGCCIVAGACTGLARREWRRAAPTRA
jgi:hypothetical protein